jgi:hypothetical protein
MSDDIVFKFVSLRAPVRAEASSLLAIEAEDGEADGFLEVLDPVPVGTPPERLRVAADRVVVAGPYLLRDGAWRAHFGNPELDLLVAESGDDVVRFRARADEVLKKIVEKDAERPQGWETKALRQNIWISYIASLFASGDRGRETRFFLTLLRIAFGVRRSGRADFDPAALQLPKRRAALPSQLFASFSAAAPPLSDSQVPIAAPAGKADSRRLSDEINALQHALKALDHAKTKKRRRLIDETLERHQAPAPSAKALLSLKTSSSSAQKALAAVPFPPPAPASHPRESSLQHLTAEDLGDAKASKTLSDFGLDPADGAAGIRDKLLELIGSRVFALNRLQTRETLSFERGAFVRVRRPANLAEGVQP